MHIYRVSFRTLDSFSISGAGKLRCSAGLNARRVSAGYITGLAFNARDADAINETTIYGRSYRLLPTFTIC